MKMRLDTLTNLAMLIFCIVGTVTLVMQWRSSSAADRNALDAPPTGYNVGESIAVDGVDFSQADRTLLLVVRKDCRFCQASMPFYTRLFERKSKATANLRFVVLSYDDQETSRADFEKHGLSPDAIHHIESDQVKAPGTPALVAVSRASTVEASWLGQLRGGQEAEVEKVLFAGR